jgi:fimbrial chaperone protein
MTTIPPGSSQIVRLVRVSKTPAAREESYRLLVDEIADTAAKEKIGIALQLRYSIPVFVMPDAGAPLRLSLSGRLEGGELLVDAINSGDTHAQLSNVSIECANGSAHALNPGLVGYVLPATNRQWRFALPAAADKAVREAHAIVNGQRVRIALQE